MSKNWSKNVIFDQKNPNNILLNLTNIATVFYTLYSVIFKKKFTGVSNETFLAFCTGVNDNAWRILMVMDGVKMSTLFFIEIYCYKY